MRNLCAVIVTWNSADSIDRCLASCGDVPVVVVDNASTDSTTQVVRRHPSVYLIANSENRGFAAAVNQGVAASAADYVLLLNPDAELTSPIEALAAACDEPGVAIACGQLTNSDGCPQMGFTIRRLPTPAALGLEVLGLNRLVPGNPINKRYHYLDMNLTQATDVEQPAGAFLMFRRQLWRELGGFDEQFHPVWFEDVDFCKRALSLSQNARIRYLPSVSARHQGGKSISHLDWESRQRFWYGSLLRYASKHFRTREFRGVCAAVLLAAAGRALTGMFQRRSVKPFKVFGGLCSLTVKCLVAGHVPTPAEASSYQQASKVGTVSGSTK